jgi:hypothetical protein
MILNRMILKTLIFVTIATYELIIFQDSNYAKIADRTDIKVVTIESKQDVTYTYANVFDDAHNKQKAEEEDDK